VRNRVDRIPFGRPRPACPDEDGNAYFWDRVTPITTRPSQNIGVSAAASSGRSSAKSCWIWAAAGRRRLARTRIFDMLRDEAAEHREISEPSQATWRGSRGPWVPASIRRPPCTGRPLACRGIWVRPALRQSCRCFKRGKRSKRLGQDQSQVGYRSSNATRI
jgi:hypothetical protein